MIQTPIRPLVLFMAALCCPLLADAQVAAEDQQDVAVVPVYDIEVIIFEYVDGVRGNREDWAYIDTGREAARLAFEAQSEARRAADALARGDMPAGRNDALMQDPDRTESQQDSAPTDADGEPLAEPLPLEFSPLDSSDYRLQDQYDRMRSSRDYRPLFHVAWRQPVYDQDNETTLALDRLSELPASLAATASIYVNRFLHLTLDLELAGGPGPGLQTTIYRLNERRKMRSAELHFYDHPRFGALALISRTEETRTLEPVVQ